MLQVARSVVAFACFLASFGASAFDGSLEVVSGSGQTTFFGTRFRAPLVARLVDGNGMPLAGVNVTFEADFCNGFEGSTCPLASAYPHVSDSDAAPFVATTDSNGIVRTEPPMAGLEPGLYVIFAWLLTDSGFIEAFFQLQQVAPIATVPITPAFTGAWYDAAQPGHGIFLEVLPSQRVLAYWFAFTPDGAHQSWFGGDGAITSDLAVVEANGGTGGRWIPNFDAAHYAPQRWGGLTFAFTDCDHGRVWFVNDSDDTSWGSGSMEIARLTQPVVTEGACF
jgi:hypothetical protein